MPGPADIWGNSPFAQAYFASNPNSIFRGVPAGTSTGNNAPYSPPTGAPVGPTTMPSTPAPGGNNAPGTTLTSAGASTNIPPPMAMGNNADGVVPNGLLSGIGVDSASIPHGYGIGLGGNFYNDPSQGPGGTYSTPFGGSRTGQTDNNTGNQVGMMRRSVTSFAAGGMVTSTGGAIRPGMPMQGQPAEDEPVLGADAPTPMSGTQIDQEARQMAQRNPQAMQHVMQLVTAAIQEGIITPDKLNLMVQLAKAAIANPNAYAQIRQFAIKNGLGNETEIPQRYDPGLLYVLITIGNAMQNGGAQTINGMGPGNPGQQNTSGQPKGGLLPEYEEGGMTGKDKHLAMVHGNEYIMPADVTLYHGKKHFDKLVEQARTPKDDASPK